MEAMKGVTSIRFDATGSLQDNALIEGRDFCFDAFRFEQHLIAKVDPLALDLLRVAVGVYVADRMCRRTNRAFRSATSRDMVVDIQVGRPEFWGDPYVRSLIEDILRFLSADLWRLSFSRLAHNPTPRQGTLPYQEQQQPIICLYSGGLDSAAGLATWLKDHADPILATTVLHQSHLEPLCRKHIHLLRNHYQRQLGLASIRVQLLGAGRLDSQE